jgi:hypothetical protein
VITLVLWSFAISLTPVVLGVAFQLVSASGRAIAFRLSRAFESAERWQGERVRRLDESLGSNAMAGSNQRIGARQILSHDCLQPC